MSRRYEVDGDSVYDVGPTGEDVPWKLYAACVSESAAERIASLLNKDSTEAAAWLRPDKGYSR